MYVDTYVHMYDKCLPNAYRGGTLISIPLTIFNNTARKLNLTVFLEIFLSYINKCFFFFFLH